MPNHQFFHKRNNSMNLTIRVIRQAEIVTAIDDFDADGKRIDVGLSRPFGDAGMPGTLVLIDQSKDACVFFHHVVSRNL